jgi:methylase of polypeptide subunit release factors
LFRSINPNNFLDIGGGTGELALLLAKNNKMRGAIIDKSKAMLERAGRKLCEYPVEIINRSVFQAFRTSETNYEVITCIGDTLNYISPKKLSAFFLRLRQYMSRDSLFFIDYNRKEFYEKLCLGNHINLNDFGIVHIYCIGNSIRFEFKFGEGLIEKHIQYLYKDHEIEDAFTSAGFTKYKDITDVFNNEVSFLALRYDN